MRSLQQASRNADQANSLLQVMQGGATQIESILERMKELATQSNSDTVDSSSRTAINNEFTSLMSEIDRIANTTQFNGRNLIDGTFGNTVNVGGSDVLGALGVASVAVNGAAADTYTMGATADGELTITNSTGDKTEVVAMQDGAHTITSKLFGFSITTAAGFDASLVGGSLTVPADLQVDSGDANFMVSSSANYDNSVNGDLLSMSGVNLTATGLGMIGESVNTAANAQSALTAIDSALTTINTSLGDIGAMQNRIGFATANTASLVQNTQAAVSTIKDADMAQEMTEFSRLQILQQAGTAMLAQANQAPQQVLQLFR